MMAKLGINGHFKLFTEYGYDKNLWEKMKDPKQKGLGQWRGRWEGAWGMAAHLGHPAGKVLSSSLAISLAE